MTALGVANAHIVPIMVKAFSMDPPHGAYLTGLTVPTDGEHMWDDRRKVNADIHATAYLMYRTGQLRWPRYISIQWHSNGTPMVTVGEKPTE